MKLFSKNSVLIVGMLCCLNFGYGQLLITEFQSSNLSTILDTYGNYSEWVEIYNSSSSSISLDGYTLSDDFENPFKCTITNVSVNPGSYRLIWLDSRNKDGYCDLNLDPSGEELYLFSPLGQLIDSVKFGRQALDASYGRNPSNPDIWSHYAEPTPGKANNGSGIQYFAQSVPVNFSLVGGMYSDNQEIQLFTDSSEGIIRFTLDGSWPKQTSQKYASSIQLSTSTVIRARLFEEDKLPGDVVTQTYILNDETTVPVICLTVEPDDFFSDEEGMFVEGTNGSLGSCFEDPANWNNDWERPINFEYFTPQGIQEVNQLAGSKITGKCSRARPFKSMGVFARKKYGNNRLNYQFFRSKDVSEYKTILLRNGGNDSWRTLMRDGFMQSLLIDQMDVDYQAFEPAIVFVNGEYWGILNIREKINEHYPASNYQLDSDEIDMLEKITYSATRAPISGSSDHYGAMYEYIMTNDLSDQAHFDHVAAQMDINEFLNYYLVEIYFENFDWPTNNVKYWRPRVEGGKWRWVLYDTDFGWGAYSGTGNIIKYSTTTDKDWTWLIKGLLDNDGFRNEYYQRMAVLWNTVFNPDRVFPILDSLTAIMDAEINHHYDRWNTPSLWSYRRHLEEVMPAFTLSRPGEMATIMKDNFGLSGLYELSVNSSDPSRGIIKACNIDLPQNFIGTFFNDVPLRLEAVPRSGYTFSHWEGASSSNSANIYLDVSTDATITAIFNEVVPLYNIVINELDASSNSWIEDNYGQSEDWIEIYNGHDFDVNLAGWYLTDSIEDETKFMIPSGYPEQTIIEAGGYLIIWCDGTLKQGPLHANFKLDRDGESLKLLQAVGDSVYLRDYINYSECPSQLTYGRSLLSDQWEYLVPTPRAANVNTNSNELYINEFVTKGSALFIDELGESDDWIEVYNPTADTIDLGGLYMTDSLSDPLKYLIPSHPPITLIPPHGYKILWADGEPEQGPLHLGFKLDGDKEQIGLYQIGVGFIDSLAYQKTHPESVLGRYPDGSSNVQMGYATPGESNQERILENIHINEVMTKNGGSHFDEFGEYDDWIELYNDNDFPVDIGGTFMTDSLGDQIKHRIPTFEPDSTTIPAKGYLVLWADNQENQGVLHLGFKLNGKGEQLALSSQNGELIVDSLSFPDQYSHFSYSRQNDIGKWKFLRPTFGSRNLSPVVSGIRINEFMTSNTSLADEYGEYDDLIELHNITEIPVDVGGMYLTDSLGDPTMYRIPSHSPELTTVQPKGYFVFYADNQSDQGVHHTNFRLSRNGEQIGLIHFDEETIIDSLTYQEQYKNTSIGRIGDDLAWTPVPPSPGAQNEIPDFSALVINEVMGSNNTIYMDEYNEYDDWIELYNGGSEPIDIGGIFISDSCADPTQCRISSESPDSTTILPQDYLILWADGSKEEGILHMDFKISKTGEDICVYWQNGMLIDSVNYPFISPDLSWGRIADGDERWTLFNRPTPLQSNLLTEMNDFGTENPIASLYPNPVTKQATFKLWLEDPGRIRIEIIDLQGSVVSILQYDHSGTGKVNIDWDVSDASGNRLKEGLYLYRISFGTRLYNGKFLVQ